MISELLKIEELTTKYAYFIQQDLDLESKFIEKRIRSALMEYNKYISEITEELRDEIKDNKDIINFWFDRCEKLESKLEDYSTNW